MDIRVAPELATSKTARLTSTVNPHTQEPLAASGCQTKSAAGVVISGDGQVQFPSQHVQHCVGVGQFGSGRPEFGSGALIAEEQKAFGAAAHCRRCLVDRFVHRVSQQQEVDDSSGMRDQAQPFPFSRRDPKTFQQPLVCQLQNQTRIEGVGGESSAKPSLTNSSEHIGQRRMERRLAASQSHGLSSIGRQFVEQVAELRHWHEKFGLPLIAVGAAIVALLGDLY